MRLKKFTEDKIFDIIFAMRSYQEIVIDYLDKVNRQENINKVFCELLNNAETKRMISIVTNQLNKYYSKEDIQNEIEPAIFEILRDAKSKEYANLGYMKTAIWRNVNSKLKKNSASRDSLDEDYENRNSKDLLASNNTTYTTIGAYKEKMQPEPTSYDECREFLRNLQNDGITQEKDLKILMAVYDIEDLYNCKNLGDITDALRQKNIKTNYQEVCVLLKKYGQRSKSVANLLRGKYSFIDYSIIIEYLLSANNKKLKLPELILDFNKIRNYLSVILLNGDIKDRKTLMEKCQVNVSTYEKDVHRILSWFHKIENDIFSIREDVKTKKYSPNQFSKIYDIHTVTNLVSNFLILHILGKHGRNGITLKSIVDELFSKTDKKDGIQNFRKYNLLPRLKELEEYGLVLIENDRYSLCENAKILTSEQKEALKYAVPFFCGLYPFTSIGHFLAGRLEIEELFDFDDFNMVNVLDDCITFDMLTAIDNNKTISIRNKNGEDKTITPIEIRIDEKRLLKVIDNKNQDYYLHEIDEVIYDEKPNNLIFSEIFGSYYKVFEELVNNNKTGKDDIAEVLKKYASDDAINEKRHKNAIIDTIYEVLPKLQKLKRIAIPLTNLELRWLKTIMQDERFDLFLPHDKKYSLECLVKNVEPFNLDIFKIYDKNNKKYKYLKDAGLPQGINKDEFRENLCRLNSVMFSIDKNSFNNFKYKNC